MGYRAITNFESLAENEMRLDALALAEAGYAAIDVGATLIRKLHIENETLHVSGTETDTRTYPLAGRRIFFVGVGKCAVAAATTIEKLFGDRITAGIALDVIPPPPLTLSRIETYVGTHPLPGEANERATKRIIALISECREDDLVLMLISGGGSTLLCLNTPPMTHLDESGLFTKLTEQGASIQDINTVRKHASVARGGGLAKAAYPAEVVSLIVSDVPENDIRFIASGPTVRDTSTVADAQAVLVKYQISPASGFAFIETPKDEKYFERVTNLLFLTNRDALLAMQDEAVRRGYVSTIMSDHVAGEASLIGREILKALHAAPPKTVLLYAGESTVATGDHSGAGGRNQELALGVIEEINSDELILPLASDGHDNTDHAGAIADTTTRAHAAAHNLSITEYLEAHRSYDFFTTSGDAIFTGYTGSNVSDLIIAIKN